MGFQIFISYKHTDENGKPTPDAGLAGKVHDYLVGRGLKEVFLSSTSLRQLGVSGYKKAIDEALDHASVLIVVGSSRSNVESEWVRYEWDSFLNEMLSGLKPRGRVFAYITGMKPADLPRALRQHQTFTHSDESLQHLYEFVANALGEKPIASPPDETKRRARPLRKTIAAAVVALVAIGCLVYFMTRAAPPVREGKGAPDPSATVQPAPAPTVPKTPEPAAGESVSGARRESASSAPVRERPERRPEKKAAKAHMPASAAGNSKPVAGLTPVMVRSAPQGARIYVDGSLRGTAPATLMLSVGKHQVQLALAGHETVNRQVAVEETMEYPLAFSLRPVGDSEK